MFAERVTVFAIVSSVFLLIPAGELGQREHLLAAALLPYLILFAQRLDGRSASVTASVAAGMLAGLGCALKPRYGAVFVVLEGVGLLYGLRPWRVLPIAALATATAYAGLVVVVCPAYLQRAVPMALALYGATDVPMLDLLSDSALLIAGIMVAFGLLWLRRHEIRDRSLMLTLLVFAATSTVICFVDGKDWFYHRLPATIATVLALMLWIAAELRHASSPLRRLSVVGAVLTLAAFCFNSAQLMQPELVAAIEPRTTAVQRLEQIIKAEHARSYIAFSEWIALGFPVVNETGVVWASRFTRCGR